MAKGKKKHVCAECGEEFPHAITLRRHQRKTGHKGSEVVDPSESPKPPEPAPEPPKPAEKVAPQPAAQPAPEEAPPPPAPPEPVAGPMAASPDQEAPAPRQPLIQIDRQKLSLFGRGIQYLLAYRAKNAEAWLKQSAASTASVMSESVKLAAILLVALSIPFLCYIAYRIQTPSRPAPPVYSAQAGIATEAKGALLGFYAAIDQRDYGRAYQYLSSGWRSELPYETFLQGFQQTREVGCHIEAYHPLSENQVQVDFVLSLQELNEPRVYQGRYVVVRTSSGWRIDSGEIQLSQTSSNPQPAS